MPDIIALSEVWSNLNNYTLQGFHPLIVETRKDKRGGGVGLLFKNELQPKKISELSTILPYMEIVTSTYLNKKERGIICSIYRPPSLTKSNLEKFFSELKKTLAKIRADFPNTPLKIAGDFNINMVCDNDLNTINLLNLMEDNNLFPSINRPTRIYKASATIIDNIFVSNPLGSEQFIIPTSISDHLFLIHTICQNVSNSAVIKNRRCFTETSINDFRNKLNQTSFDSIINCNEPERAYELFFDLTDRIFLETFPLKKFSNKPVKKQPWITNEIMLEKKVERKLYIKSLLKGTDFHINKHSIYKKNLNKNIRSAKIKYNSQFFNQNKKNSKKIWQFLNVDIKGSTSNQDIISSIKTPSINLEDPILIAKHMNKFFSEIGSKIANNIPTDNIKLNEYVNNLPQTPNIFKFTNITDRDIIRLNKTIQPKTSSGPDGLPNKVLKNILELKPNVISKLMNLSLQHAYVPVRLKTAKIIPIYKKSGNKDDPNNYRPISLLNTLSKILEKLVAKQLRNHLDINNILYKRQFGFRKNHSTTHAMIATLKHLEQMKSNNVKTNAIFLDLKKAFDTVSHTILLRKLSKYGIQNNELDWFLNYLKDRKQFTSIGDTESDLLNVEIGVPQGSVLGPLLFCIFINDLPDFLPNDDLCNLFADDTAILISSKEENNLKNKTDNTLKLAKTWFELNKLTLNISKTKVIQLNHTNNNSITLDNVEIKKVHSKSLDKDHNSFKFLGFHLDEKVNFLSHKKKLIQKLNSSIYILRKLNKQYPSKQKCLIYNALFKSNMEYGIVAWSNDQALINKIFTLQKKAIRLIDGRLNLTHTEHIFKKYKILKLNDLIYLNRVMLAHSVKYEYAPETVCNCLAKVMPHPSLRRNLNNFVADGSNKKSIFNYLIPTTWNDLPNSNKEIASKNKFKNKIKNSFINNYSHRSTCNSLDCRICN